MAEILEFTSAAVKGAELAEVAYHAEPSEPNNGEYRIKDYTAERGNWLDDDDFDGVVATVQEIDRQRKLQKR